MSEKINKISIVDSRSDLKFTVKNLTEENKKLRTELANSKRASRKNEALLKQIKQANHQLVLSTLHAYTDSELAELKFREITKNSQRDELTGAANRSFMGECIKLAIHSTKRHKKNFALLFIDLDRFKPVNDCFGHAMGDHILKSVAHRITSVIRESDTLGRYGGDEFLVLLNDISDQYGVDKVAKKMSHVLAEPYHVDGHQIKLAASIGVAIYPKDGRDAETLISHADNIMYRVKRQGGNGYSK